jgi:ABC-2 type transport system permease protein
MNSVAYTRYELLRAFRNRRFFVFSLGFPVVLFFIIAAPNSNVSNFADSGVSAPLYYMVSRLVRHDDGDGFNRRSDRR